MVIFWYHIYTGRHPTCDTKIYILYGNNNNNEKKGHFEYCVIYIDKRQTGIKYPLCIIKLAVYFFFLFCECKRKPCKRILFYLFNFFSILWKPSCVASSVFDCRYCLNFFFVLLTFYWEKKGYICYTFVFIHIDMVAFYFPM